MTYDKELEILKEWASENPLVKKVYFFGSRYKGTNRPDSDFDVAVEIIKGEGDGNLLATWIFEGSELKQSLQNLIDLKLDLQWYSNEHETPDMHEYLQEGSMVVYEKKHLTKRSIALPAKLARTRKKLRFLLAGKRGVKQYQNYAQRKKSGRESCWQTYLSHTKRVA